MLRSDSDFPKTLRRNTSFTNAIKTTIPVSGPWLAITPNGKFAYVTNADFDTVKVIDSTTNTLAATITGNPCSVYGWTTCYGTGVAIGPNGKYAYTASHGDFIYVIDATQAAALKG
jgi:YVTN family beta-propeller protein